LQQGVNCLAIASCACRSPVTGSPFRDCYGVEQPDTVFSTEQEGDEELTQDELAGRFALRAMMVDPNNMLFSNPVERCSR